MELKKEIHFETIIKHDGEIQKYENIVEGHVVFKENQVDYISFVDEGDGEDFVATDVTFFIEDEAIIMQRDGDVVMEQRFTEHAYEHGLYQVPEGRFSIGAKATSIIMDFSKATGKFELRYTSYFSNEIIGTVTVKVMYK